MVDDAKLKALRERYQNALGGEMFDPKFKAVAEQQFASGDRRKWPFEVQIHAHNHARTYPSRLICVYSLPYRSDPGPTSLVPSPRLVTLGLE